MVIRPVRIGDFDQLMALVSQSGFGLTNLPADRELMARRIEAAAGLFSAGSATAAPAAEPDAQADGEPFYMLVMEDPATGRVVGTGSVVPRVGVNQPFYAYLRETHRKESPGLGIREDLECLHLLEINNGWSEIGGLFVHPAYQGRSHGRLMSLSRFLFMAEHVEAFDDDVIAEMRGVIHPDGRSPFWEGLGRHFFKMDFPRADYLSVKHKGFIAELMPRHPVYTVLLPETARSVIGRVHPKTRPALGLLTQEGFTTTRMIDIFDGGPIIRCKVAQVRTVKESQSARFSGRLADDAAENPDPRIQPLCMIATGRMDRFRACLGIVAADGTGQVRVSAAAADRLAISKGEIVRFAAVRPKKEDPS